MNTISNERLEKLSEYDCADRYEVMSMATELLALRKERERAEPVGEVVDQPDGFVMDGTVHLGGSGTHRAIKGLNKMKRMPLGTKFYTAPPVPDERYQQLSELYHAQEKRLFKLAQRIKGLSFDKYAHSPSQAIDVLEAAIFGEADEDGRTAMLHSVMQPCDKCGLTGIHACMGGMETDTTSQQFESLAGKAVYGWIACSERMPEHGVDVQIFCSDTKEQFVGFRCIGGNDFQYGHYEGVAIVCSPSHWQPLPEPPCK